MTVIELAMKLNCFKSIEEASRLIKLGALKVNSTTCKNPTEALVFGQHILMNYITIVKAGKSIIKNYIKFDFI
jgi:hypothetical protein